MAAGTLLLATIDMIKAREQSLPDLAIEVGVPFYWLRKIASNDIKDPSVNRIQKLYEHLSGHKLAVT